MMQVDEESRISFFDGNQGPKQCTSQCYDIVNDRNLNCVRAIGHEGIHESHDGDVIWRDKVTREMFRRAALVNRR